MCIFIVSYFVMYLIYPPQIITYGAKYYQIQQFKLGVRTDPSIHAPSLTTTAYQVPKVQSIDIHYILLLDTASVSIPSAEGE
jgi:hypothetical protein